MNDLTHERVAFAIRYSGGPAQGKNVSRCVASGCISKAERLISWMRKFPRRIRRCGRNYLAETPQSVPPEKCESDKLRIGRDKLTTESSSNQSSDRRWLRKLGLFAAGEIKWLRLFTNTPLVSEATSVTSDLGSFELGALVSSCRLWC